MADKLVHDRVWELLQRMRDSAEYVGRFYGGERLQRPDLARPLVDRHRRGVHTSGRPVIYGAEEHQALKDWITPKRFGRRPGAEAKEQHDNWAIRRATLIGSLRTAVGTADGRYGGMQEAVTNAWIAAHLDRVVDDLRGSGHLPSNAAEFRLEWDTAGDDEKQRLLADIHPNAPTAYAFAEAVGERAGMSAERTLHWLNNAPPYATADVAAGLLMRDSEQSAAVKAEVSQLIRTEFENATPGRRTAELAIELIDRPAVREQAEIQLDPRVGVKAPGSPSNGAGQATSGTATPAKSPGRSLGMG